MAESRNKLRGNKSKAPVIYTIVIISLMGLSFILYATYAYLSYIYANKIENPTMNDIIASLNTLFTAESFALPITLDVIKEVFIMQVRDIWWVYVGVAVVVFLAMTSRNPNDFKGMEYGSARWANKYEESKFKDSTGIPCGNGFYLTTKQKKGKYYVPNNLNETVIGGSGAGKSFRKIKPDIIQMTGSYIITDPSGELYRDMGKFLKKNGYKVKVLNLNDIKLSNTYNPFKYMMNEEDVLKVANMFIENSGEKGEKGDFWTAASRKLLTVIMLYLFHSEDEVKSFNRVMTLLCSIEFKDGHISDNCLVARCIKRHQLQHHNTQDDAVSILWNSLKTSPPETFGGISETLSTKLQQWTVKAVDILTATDEMDFDDIGVHKTAIFVIQPAADTTYKAIANIFFRQLFARLQYIAELKYKNRLPLLVSFELDEFANIGEIPNFNLELAVIRKYNIRVCIVLQAFSQLKSVYDEKIADGILSNCSTLTYLGTTDKDTTDYVSWKLGKTTVRVDTKSYNRGNQGGGTDSESYVARDLLTTDEISKAVQKGENGKAIIFVDTFYPFFVDKFDLASHKHFAEIGSDRNPAQEVNNANLEKDYRKHYKELEKKYDDMKKKAKQLSDEVNSGKYDEPVTTEEKQKAENSKLLFEKFEKNPHKIQNANNAPYIPDNVNEDDIAEDIAEDIMGGVPT